MRYFPREKTILVLVVPSLILLAFMLLVTTNTITNVSGVVTEGVGVYRDSGCTDADEVFSIDWETLTPGSAREYNVYVRNEDVVPIYLIKETKNWDPSNAYYYLTLTWNYAGQKIDLGDVLQLTLTLSVDPYIKDISDFCFDIVIYGSDRLPGDVDGDGIITGLDLLLVTSIANFMKPVSEAADPLADVTGDGLVNGLDLLIVSRAL